MFSCCLPLFKDRESLLCPLLLILVLIFLSSFSHTYQDALLISVPYANLVFFVLCLAYLLLGPQFTSFSMLRTDNCVLLCPFVCHTIRTHMLNLHIYTFCLTVLQNIYIRLLIITNILIGGFSRMSGGLAGASFAILGTLRKSLIFLVNILSKSSIFHQNIVKIPFLTTIHFRTLFFTLNSW